MPARIDFAPDAPWPTVVPDPTTRILVQLWGLLPALAADARFRPGVGVLVDVRRVERVPTPEEARELATACADPGALGGHPVAMLVTAGTAHEDVCTLVTTLAALAGGVAHLFTDPDEARRWLDERTATVA